MPTLKAEFDGQVFVPCEAVALPAGTRVDVVLPAAHGGPDEDEQREWREIREEISAGAPPFPNLDEAMRQTRNRP